MFLPIPPPQTVLPHTEQGCSENQLQALSETTLKQPNDREYDTELRTRGVETVYKNGVAFSGKNVEVAVG